MIFNRSIKTLFLLMLTTGWIAAASTPLLASDLVVTRYFSGLWDQPRQESQGIVLQIIDQEEDGKKKAVAYWFTYGDDEATAWFMGIGAVEGEQVVLTLYTAEGVDFMEENLPGNASVYEVGSLVLSFHNCNHGVARFDTAEEVIGTGEFDIKKLAGLYNSRCSGGISDDTPNDARPKKLDVELLPARDDISGSGDATFWERADRSDFVVHVRGMSDGTYGLKVCDFEDTFEVVDGSGKAEYRSPASDSKRHLTFHPGSCRIDVSDGDGVALTSGDDRLAEKEHGNNGNGNGHGNGNGRDDITAEMDNVSDIPDAGGTAEYTIKNNSTEFEVEIERVPVGPYTLFIDGMNKGQIDVVMDGDKTKGRIRFSDPQKEERQYLGFDPRGSLIVVENASGPILEVIFPFE